jgi:Arc/MetJ-type ribon-helix-helix transcriptional regulator
VPPFHSKAIGGLTRSLALRSLTWLIPEFFTLAPSEHEKGKNASFELEENEATLAALRAALDECEASGAATAFDFEAFFAEKRQRQQKTVASWGV